MENIKIEIRKKLKIIHCVLVVVKSMSNSQATFFIRIPRYMPEIKDSSGFAKNARKSFIADMCSSLEIHTKQWNVCVKSLIYTTML